MYADRARTDVNIHVWKSIASLTSHSLIPPRWRSALKNMCPCWLAGERQSASIASVNLNSKQLETNPYYILYPILNPPPPCTARQHSIHEGVRVPWWGTCR